MNIRTMLQSDLDFAANLTAAEGWDSETRQELAALMEHDPGGCFIAEFDGQQVGTCIATPYQDFGFVGDLIVLEDQRRRGTGRALLEHAIRYLHQRGAQTVFLDGVLAAIPLYERLGFQRVCRSWRMAGVIQGRAHANVRAMGSEDLESVARLDRTAFSADRRFFLERRLRLYPELCKVQQDRGQITGYIMGRRVRQDHLVSPWVAKSNPGHEGDLLESLADEIGGSRLRFGVLGAHPRAVEALQSYGLECNPGSPWRMALGKVELPGVPTLVYAIGSPAKG
jgi:ribosomal protein S18 acetylase RimI-like enzyme